MAEQIFTTATLIIIIIIIIIINFEQMLPIGAAASKRLSTTIKLNKSKIIQQRKSLLQGKT